MDRTITATTPPMTTMMAGSIRLSITAVKVENSRSRYSAARSSIGSSRPPASPEAAKVTRIGGKTSVRRMAADSPPPSRTASAIRSVASRRRRLDTVRAVIVRPSSTGRPAVIIVDRVRAIFAP